MHEAFYQPRGQKYEWSKDYLGMVACIFCGIGVIVVFIFKFLPLIESRTVSVIMEALIGSFAGLLGSFVTSIVGRWRVSKDAEERLKDRISNHALELTRLDYELRQKSLEVKGTKKHFLAPAKVYRTFYRSLVELHNSGNWPKEVQDLGLLSIFELGSNNFEGKRE
jgi:hypothetical protein